MIKIDSCHFENCGVGISTPANADIEISRNTFLKCDEAIEIRDQVSLIEALGLRPETPIEHVRELIKFVRDHNPDLQQIHKKAQEAGIREWLSTGANLGTIATTLKELMPSLRQFISN